MGGKAAWKQEMIHQIPTISSMLIWHSISKEKTKCNPVKVKTLNRKPLPYKIYMLRFDIGTWILNILIKGSFKCYIII